MKTNRVEGKNKKHHVIMYALSTCAWCKKTKQFLKNNNIEYEYVDIDQCSEEDKEKIRQVIIRHGGSLSYPTIIVDDKRLVTGYDEAGIREALEI
jgi:glutaredoxin-like protein NrdH